MSLKSRRARDDEERTQIAYTGTRNDFPAVGYELSVTIPQVPTRIAPPGTLDYFLLERYLLFATDPQRRIRTGRVHHLPYQFITPESVRGSQTITSPVACDPLEFSTASHLAYCQGVDVRVSPLKSMN